MGLDRSTCNYTQHPEEGDSSFIFKTGEFYTVGQKQDRTKNAKVINA